MRAYLNNTMGDLATQLCAGLLRLRRGYVDAAEALWTLIDPAREYPYDFVVFKLTGYRPPQEAADAPMLTGRTLRPDLLRLMLDVSASFDLRADEYAQPAYDVAQISKRLRVSGKTIQRWRRLGLPARQLVFPDGRRRIAFLESSLRAFVRKRSRRVLRSARFSQMTPAERADIIRRARRMARFARCSLMDICRRLSTTTGRAVETIRYTIRRHDLQHPQQAVVPCLCAPLADPTKLAIYQCFLHGVGVRELADRHGRTRGSIYRVINETRTKRLLAQPIECIYNPQFDLPGADEMILASPLEPADAPAPTVRPPRVAGTGQDVPLYLGELYDTPLLTPQQEHDLFRRYNYLKYKADSLRRQLNVNRVRTGQLRQIEKLLLAASAAKDRIVQANLRLVVSIAKKHTGGSQNLLELVSDGNLSLLKAVEKFDFSRGNRFSTYASWAIMRNFARSVPKERYQLDRFTTGRQELDVLAGLAAGDGELRLPELRESVEALLSRLSPRERTVLVDHYGLKNDKPLTLEEVGKGLGLSKERVRQIEAKAIRKLRLLSESPSADFAP